MSFWFIILGISVGAYWLNAWSLKHTRATVVGSYIYLQPLLAAIFGLFWGETLHPIQVLFGSLVFAGVLWWAEPINKPVFSPLQAQKT